MELKIYSPTEEGFLKSIEWNHEEIKREVAERVRYYKNLAYTDDQIADAKKDRATLNKFVQELEATRKAVKKQCLAPYEDFEKKIKEIVQIVNEPIQLIDQQIKAADQLEKDEKKKAIEKLFVAIGFQPFVTLDMIWDEKWLNKSASLTKVESQLKEALQYITGLKAKSMEPKLVEIEGRTYCTDNDLTRYHRFPMASDIEVNTLTALVDYIKGKPEELRESSIIHVVSPTRVLLHSGLIDERDRETLIDARAIVNEFSFDSYYDQERFLIELQANFVETDDLITIMQVAGNIKSGTTANYSDDGVSQKTTIKTGVELADVIVPNPVKLRPYRTFAEIEQPESSYVFRIKDGDRGPAFKLVEADGGLWKNAVMKKIKEYLEFELSEELEKHKITVIA